MSKKSKMPTIHERMVLLIKEMVEKELPIKEAIKEFEKIYIETASETYNGNKTKMAQALGIHRNTLHNLCKTLKIV
ncbi:MAG: helix-turn-helix domain-containing protein [Candidatus Aminicenantaceae bacterium]